MRTKGHNTCFNISTMKPHSESRKLYKPAFSIIAAVLIMLAVIAVSTYRNLQREEQKALSFIHRLGLTILKSIETGARSGMMMHMWKQDDIANLIHELANDPNISYFYMIDDRGTVVHSSNPTLDEFHPDWQSLLKDDDSIVARIKKDANGIRTYEMAKRFNPRDPPEMMIRMRKMMHGGMPKNPHAGNLVVIGLKMDSYEASRRADLHHAFLMGGILLVLGSSAMFFIFVIQNYYITRQHLKVSQDFSHLVTNSMADGLLSINKNGDIFFSNQQARDMLGLDAPSLLHRNFRDQNLRKWIDFKASGIDTALEERQPVINREIHLLQNAGDDVVLGVTASPLKGTDEEGAVIVLRDLTRVRELESKVIRAEKLAAVGTLAAGVAHEIRNPLSSIRGFARFLYHKLQGKPTEQEYAEIMVKEIDRINQVVTHLLDLARPMELEMTETDIATLLNHVVKLTQSDAQEKKVSIQVVQAYTGPPVLIDKDKLTQTLLNLILNSIQALDVGGAVRIGSQVSPDKAQLKIWVEDNGKGIAKDKSDQVFDPYYTTRATGTGLGLAIVSKIVEAHGGRLLIESPVPNKEIGCRVSIFLPLMKSRAKNTSDATIPGGANEAKDTHRR